jgi:hypothetical protein
MWKRAKIWDWKRKVIVWIPHTNPARILQELTLWPQFEIWSTRRHWAVLWILAHMVWFRYEIRKLSAQEYGGFWAGRDGKRTKWQVVWTKRELLSDRLNKHSTPPHGERLEGAVTCEYFGSPTADTGAAPRDVRRCWVSGNQWWWTWWARGGRELVGGLDNYATLLCRKTCCY